MTYCPRRGTYCSAGNHSNSSSFGSSYRNDGRHSSCTCCCNSDGCYSGNNSYNCNCCYDFFSPAWPISRLIVHIDRIVEAIGKQIISIHGFSRIRNSVIRANKPPELRAIIPAIEVIQPCFGIVVIAPVAEGILFPNGVAAGVGDGALTPGVVAVPGHHLARSGPHDGDDIPLHVVEIIIQRVAVGEAHPLARAVVEEQHGSVPGLLGQDLAAVEEKLRLGAVHRLGRADAVSVVLVAIGVAAVGDFPQLPALPGVGGAVVACHVADGVMADRLTVVLRQQVAPAAVVDVGAGLQGRRRQGSRRKGVALYSFDIPGVVIGIDEGGVLGLAVVAYFLFLWCLICLGISLSYFIPCL